MATFVMLTRLNHDAFVSPRALPDLEKAVMARIKDACPDVVWKDSFAVLGPYDYLDIFDAPDNEEATKVATVVRSFGHALTEVWPATQWDRFKRLVEGLAPESTEVPVGGLD
jgi:uncharacterized protein with GYD domain